MAQYLAIKSQHPDGLLFYRMGDFYEMFFEDAVVAAGALSITLTKRGKHLGQDIPMCGVPVHSHENYLSRLISLGFKVAVCEQTEDPAAARKRGNKSVVARDVVRVITAGTLTEDTLLEARRHNYLAALGEAQGGLGLAWLDVSTGAFHMQPLAGKDMGAALARLDPGEVVVSDRLIERPEFFETSLDWKDRLTPLPASRFDSRNGQRRLESLFGVHTLESFGDFGRAELAAGGALVDYVALTQKGRLPRINRPRRIAAGAVMEIDAATRRNLELAETLAGARQGSLLGVIDRTVCGAGARLLAVRLSAPLTDCAAINGRLDEVQHFIGDEAGRHAVRALLARCPDIERGLSRLMLGRGGPRDLNAIREGLALSAEVRVALAGGGPPPPDGIAAATTGLGHHGDIIERLDRALGPELPLYARDGGFISPAYAPQLDELRTLRDESRRLIARLQSRYATDTGIQNLKIRHNNVLGYFVEVPAKQAPRVSSAADAPFVHRQTMANAVRYTTVELGELEGRIGRAAEGAVALELKLFEDLVGEVAGRADEIAEAAAALAALDVAAALAELARERSHCRPVVDDSLEFDVEGGRHAVVEAALEERGGGPFVANGCTLSAAAEGCRVWLLTGPNMAGKSTYLRQNALIAVLAQMGAYVPAEAARIGVVDRLFSRVGAADDLARGRSTFMVEMVETAIILHQAGPRSLVILDEIGRGTATFDGLAIAWAVVEHLHEVGRCRTLFATHYHELTALAAKLTGLECHTMRVKEWQGDVVFLHEVTRGAAERSYGIHVGRLAGLPDAVIGRAEEVLASLEKGDQSSALTRLAEDLPLFSATAIQNGAGQESNPSPLAEALIEVDADGLTPKEALELVYRLKSMLDV